MNLVAPDVPEAPERDVGGTSSPPSITSIPSTSRWSHRTRVAACRPCGWTAAALSTNNAKPASRDTTHLGHVIHSIPAAVGYKFDARCPGLVRRELMYSTDPINRAATGNHLISETPDLSGVSPRLTTSGIPRAIEFGSSKLDGMTEQDRMHWDEKYSGDGFAPHGAPGPPTVFAAYEHLFPKSGHGSTSRADVAWRLSGSQREGSPSMELTFLL
jgi:hypothetical protein